MHDAASIFCRDAKRRQRRQRRHGFTLLEAVISLALIIALMSGVFGFYVTTLRARDTGGQIARDAMLAHAVLQRMTEEIRQATDIVPGDGIGFSGTHGKITIIRACMPDAGQAYAKRETMTEKPPPGQMDLQRITYELIWDSELQDAEGVKVCHGLLRTEQRTFDPNPKFTIKAAEGEEAGEQTENIQPDAPPIETELFAPEIKYLRFEYFDGAQWRDRWQMRMEQPNDDGTPGFSDETGGSLPQAVRITIGKVRVPPEDEEFNITQLRQMDERQKNQEHHPDRFTIVIYLLEADQSHLNSRKFGTKNNEDLQVGGEQ